MGKPSSALEGIRVIDLSAMGATPMAAELLAQWGAEVIHIEHPIRGDGGRIIQHGGSSTYLWTEVNYWWELPNLNKKSLTADLAQKEGRDILYKLAATSDVFLSNLRPYEMEKFDLQYETLKKINPKIIFANLTGYGPKGPDANAPGWDQTSFFARAGITYTLSDPDGVPFEPRPAQGDFHTSMTTACGIMVALFARERFGIGQEVYTSLFHSGVWMAMFDIQQALLTNQDPPKQKRDSVPNALVNVYKTKDARWIRLTMMQADRYWPAFCQAIEREELEKDPRFDSLEHRKENSVALIKIIDEAFAKRTAAEWYTRLAEGAQSFSLHQKPTEVINDPQARANDFFTPVDHPIYGPIELVLGPITFSETPGKWQSPGPELGQHTEEILLELGYTWEDIAQLKDKQVIA